jgi:hypothetical protein
MAHRLLALTLIYFVFIVCTFLYVNGETMNSMQSGQTQDLNGFDFRQPAMYNRYNMGRGAAYSMRVHKGPQLEA